MRSELLDNFLEKAFYLTYRMAQNIEEPRVVTMTTLNSKGTCWTNCFARAISRSPPRQREPTRK